MAERQIFSCPVFGVLAFSAVQNHERVNKRGKT